MSQPTAAADRIAQRFDNIPGPKKCTYRAIELVNGAGACLIQENEDADPYGREPQANLVVSLGAGRLQDPLDCRGIAELCAHLAMLDVNKGFCQACVNDDLTMYSIELASYRLDELLQKLCSGIRNPRFDEADIKAALESGEFETSRLAIDWIQRCTGNPTHPFSHLAQNDVKSIKSFPIDEIRNRLIEFHGKYYSANLLRVFAVDSRPLNELETLIANTFGEIPNRSAPKVDVSVRELDGVNNKSGGVKIRVKNTTLRETSIVFPVPDQTALLKTSPDIYVKRLLESDHEGSLRSSLEPYGLSPCAYLMDFGQLGFDFFCIGIHANEEKDQIEQENIAIKLVFRYLAMIRSLGLQNWLHSEYRVTLQSEFAPKDDKDDYPCHPDMERSFVNLVSDDYSIATRLQRYSLKEALSARHLLTEYSEQAISDFLSYLTPDRCSVYVTDIGLTTKPPCEYSSPSGKFCCIPEGQPVECSVEKLPQDLLTICSAPWPNKDCELDKKFKMPKPKAFMPKDISLRPRVAKAQPSGPRQLRLPAMKNVTSANARLWFRQDDRFESERAFVSVEFIPPVESTAQNQLLLEILVQIFSRALQKLKKKAEEVCMELSISRSCSGIQFCFNGYPETLPLLIETALRNISDLKITKELIQKTGSKVFKASDEPVLKEEEIDQLARQLGLPGFWQTEQKTGVADAKGVPINDVLSIASHFNTSAKQAASTAADSKSPKASNKKAKGEVQSLNNLFAEILVFGNATAQDATAIAQSILSAMPSLTSATKMAQDRPELLRQERLLKKGSYSTIQRGGSDVCVAVSKNDCYDGSASICALVLQIPATGKPPISLNSSMKVLGDDFSARMSHYCMLQIVLAAASDVPVAEPFNRISRRILPGYNANSFVFQKIMEESPAKMEKHIEKFIEKLGDRLSAMSPESFQVFKQQAIQSMCESAIPNSIEQQNSMYWSRIKLSSYDFNWDDPRAVECIRAIVDGVKIQDVQNYWKKWFRSGSSDRTVLCLQNYCNREIEKSGTSGKLVTDLDKFKSSLESPSVSSASCLKNVHDA